MRIGFEAARAADPEAELIYNDFGIGWNSPKSVEMLALVDSLIEESVPLDGVGIQLHLDHTFEEVEGFSTVMQQIADRGLDVYITEFDVGVLSPDDYPAQAALYEEMLRRCLMQPACRAFQIWGLDDFHSFRPFFDPLPFDDDLRPKLAFYSMRSALSSEVIHPENCALEGFEVVSGAIRIPAITAPGIAEADVAPIARCENVRLGPGYAGLTLRYRSVGFEAPALTITAADRTLVARVSLESTLDTPDGGFATVRTDVLAAPIGTSTLTLSFEGDASAVELDALLFDSPAGPVVEGGRRGSGGGGALDAFGLVVLLLACGSRRRP